MILTCPKCATRFFAEDDEIGPAGRRVQCDSCHQVWLSNAAKPALPMDDVVDIPATSPLEFSGAPIRPEIEVNSAPFVSPLFAERAQSTRKSPAKRSARPWAVTLLILVLALVAGVFVFQRRIERAFPGTTAIYRSVGLGGSTQRADER